MSRLCARSGCGGRAVATLAYNYAERTVWISHAGDEHQPQTYDLCADHAERVSVPRGWALTDARERPLFDLVSS